MFINHLMDSHTLTTRGSKGSNVYMGIYGRPVLQVVAVLLVGVESRVNPRVLRAPLGMWGLWAGLLLRWFLDLLLELNVGESQGS